MGPCPLGPQEIEGLFVSPAKASMLLTDHLIIFNRSGLNLPRKSGLNQPHTHTCMPVGWLIFGSSPIK